LDERRGGTDDSVTDLINFQFAPGMEHNHFPEKMGYEHVSTDIDNFHNWKDEDAYRRGFDRLLHDLKASDAS
jgi:hypothetical protein